MIIKKNEDCICPICGYIDYSYINKDIIDFNFRVCSSCLYQIGYDCDDLGISFKLWRTEWVKYLLRHKKCSKELIRQQLANLDKIKNIDKYSVYINKMSPLNLAEQKDRINKLFYKHNLGCPE